jgi:hydroxypyruvate isomerase
MKSREKKLSVRVSEEEHETVARLAKAASMSVSNYGRKRLLIEPINQITVPAINLDTYRTLVNLKSELNAIGHNLNQVTKAMHTHQSIPLTLLATVTDTEIQIAQAIKLLHQIQLSSVGADRR